MNKFRLKGASGSVSGQAHALGETTVFGSDPACDLVVEDAQVSARHAEILLQSDGSLRLVRLGDAGPVMVNGQPVDDVLLKSGDEIRLATCRWVLQAPGLRPQKILTEAALKPRPNIMPWVLAAALIAAGALAWYKGWLPF